MIINEYARFTVAIIKLQFEVLRCTGIFWFVENFTDGEIVEPFNKFYIRHKKLKLKNDKAIRSK